MYRLPPSSRNTCKYLSRCAVGGVTHPCVSTRHQPSFFGAAVIFRECGFFLCPATCLCGPPFPLRSRSPRHNCRASSDSSGCAAFKRSHAFGILSQMGIGMTSKVGKQSSINAPAILSGPSGPPSPRSLVKRSISEVTAGLSPAPFLRLRTC